MADNVTSALVAANEAFYDAFDTGDMQAMEALWAREHDVACLHPGAEPLFGREAVLRSWADILSGSGRPAIQCLDPRPIAFERAGVVVCFELLAGGRLVATNAFVTENGVWRMVHHQAGPISRPA
ncbi:MAG TPA: nuclear transport factor 2 family protein [Alphaproteobacteria bacterium]|nr:nuclear transport factor 2 family protein [Alphaproteobacteria bacterium]